MANPAYILIPGKQSWTMASQATGALETQVDPDAAPQAIAQAVALGLRSQGYRGHGVVLGLPSEWCLAARVSLKGLPSRDLAALVFRLEEQLPLAAEQFTADFVRAGDKALGVAVNHERIAPLVAALEQAGVVVASIAPLALLAAQSLDAPPEATILWNDGPFVSLISLHNGQPAAWSVAEPSQLDQAMRLLELEHGPAGEVMTLGINWNDAPRRDLPMLEAAMRTVGRVLRGRLKPWFELRRGAMGSDDSMRMIRPALNAMLAGAAALLIGLAIALFVRGSKYDRLAQESEIELTEAFGRQFPGWSTPRNVLAVVESEHRKLLARGRSDSPSKSKRSALALMRDVLGGLPNDARLVIERMSFNESSIEIEGKAKVYEDVSPLTASARSAGLDVPTPQMRKAADGSWSFVLRGTQPAAAKP